jgi:transcriptional regulator with XRE-family HTH domain
MPGVKGRSGRKITTPPPWGTLYEVVGGQEKLATKLGVSKATVGKWATGVHRIPELVRKEVLRLCKYHGIDEGLEKI